MPSSQSMEAVTEMKTLRSALAVILSAALIHAPVSAATIESLKLESPAAAQVIMPSTLLERPLPAIALDADVLAPIAPAFPTGLNVAETINAPAANPAAMATLNVMTGEVAKAQEAGQPAALSGILDRYMDGSNGVSPASDLGVSGSFSAAPSSLAPASKSAASAARTVQARKDFGGSAVDRTKITVAAVIGGIVLIVGIIVGVMWHNANEKNKEWNDSKSNQDIVLIEKSRRAADSGDKSAEDTLYKVGVEARARQGRMKEGIDDAKSKGDKNVENKTGDDLKKAEFFRAADGLVGARAEINHNAVSQDASKRIGKQLPAAWASKLAEEDRYAQDTRFEGNLALALQELNGELKAEQAKGEGLKQDLADFDRQVPNHFKGRLGDMSKKGQADLREYQTKELDAENATFAKHNDAMRARVKAKLADGSAEFKTHQDHLKRLSDARDVLKPAVEIAAEADKQLEEMARYERDRVANLALAAQNERVWVEDRDDQGRPAGGHYEDRSDMYKKFAAEAGAKARAAAAGAQGSLKALKTILPLLRTNGTLKEEGLASLIPVDPKTRVDQRGSVFFDFWMDASWTLFFESWNESAANQARGAFGPIKGQLDGAYTLIGERESEERSWVNGSVDAELKAQIEKAKQQKAAEKK
jgi:hypothetical protein